MMSIFEYTVEMWITIFGSEFAEANSTLISDLSVLTVLLMVGVFVFFLCSIIKSIFNRCTP